MFNAIRQSTIVKTKVSIFERFIGALNGGGRMKYFAC